MIHVYQLYGQINCDAVTDPFLGHLDSPLSTNAVIKTNNNRQGNLSLINEYIAYQLCELFNISIPQSGVCIIDDKTILGTDDNKPLDIFDPKYHYGPAFYSTYIENAIKFVPRMITKVDKAQIANMLVFDHLIYNCDRHEGNVLIEAGKRIHFYLIDHSHIFKNECIWNSYTFEQGMSDNDYRDECIFDSNIRLYKQSIIFSGISKEDIIQTSMLFQAKLTPPILHSIINQMPAAWTTGRENDISALECYLLYRLEHLSEIANLIIRKGGL